jgi:hypothetical protein
LQHLGDWQLVRRIRETRGVAHWQTANGFLLVELPSDVAKTPAKARAFVRDVEAFAGVFRPDIARVVDWASAAESTYVVLEVPAGATLLELAQKTQVPPDVRVRVALDALDAVEAAHASGAVFGDLDPDSIVISEHGQVVLLPTCSRARAATPEDDIAAVARLAELQDRPESARVLKQRLRAAASIAPRETVGRFVSRVFLNKTMPPPRGASHDASLRSMTPAPRQMPRAPYAPKPPPPRAPFRPSSADDELTPVIPIGLKRLPSLEELSPDDLIPVGISEPDIPIYIEEPPDPRDTERPVVSEPDIVIDLRTTPAKKRRRFPLLLLATLCAACAIAVPLFWRDATTWLRSAGLIPHRAPRPAPAFEQHAPAAQPPAVTAAQPREATAAPAAAPASPAASEIAEADAAPPALTTPVPAKHRPALRRRTQRATGSETDETPRAVEPDPRGFVPTEP